MLKVCSVVHVSFFVANTIVMICFALCDQLQPKETLLNFQGYSKYCIKSMVASNISWCDAEVSQVLDWVSAPVYILSE